MRAKCSAALIISYVQPVPVSEVLGDVCKIVPSVQHNREVQNISCLHEYQVTHRPSGRVITHNSVSVPIGTFSFAPHSPPCRDGSDSMLLLLRTDLTLQKSLPPPLQLKLRAKIVCYTAGMNTVAETISCLIR
jgi:hypothetical protein